MKEILDFLKRFESKRRTAENLKIVLYSDGSGKILECYTEDELFEFHSLDELFEKINEKEI